jgi:hypothetical protein
MDAQHEKKFSCLVISGLGLYVLWFILPAAIRMPHCDSGIFLYCGSRAAAGEVPYIDFWDHKGPLIFYINAVASILSPGATTGSAILQFLFVFGAFMFCWKVLKKAFGFAPALVGTLCILPLMEVAELKYNFTEIYALFFQFGALYCFYRSEQVTIKQQALFLRFLLGLLIGCAFMLRPNLVAVGGAIALSWIITAIMSKDYKGLWSRVWPSAAGYMLVWAIFSVYFLVNGAFMAFLDGMIFFNYNATESSALDWLKGIGFGIFLTLPASLFAIVAWLALIYKHRQHKLHLKPLEPLVLTALFYLPIEMVVSSVSGRMYNHYFMAWLPPIALLVAIGLKELFAMPAFQKSRLSFINGKKGFAVLMIGLALLPQTWSIVGNTIHYLRVGKAPPGRLIKFIAQNSVPADNVLVCSYFAGGVYYMTGRKAPSKYVVQFNFWIGSKEHWKRMNSEFLADISKKRPKYIIWLKNNSEIRPQVEMVVKNAGIRYSYSSNILPGSHVFTRIDGIPAKPDLKIPKNNQVNGQ